jgi:hypothetical protein
LNPPISPSFSREGVATRLPVEEKSRKKRMALSRRLALREDRTLQQLDDPNRVIVADQGHEAIRKSRQLRDMLKSARLERCIRFIDGAEDPAAALERAMLNPELRRFVDEALVLLGKAEKRRDGTVEFTG